MKRSVVMLALFLSLAAAALAQVQGGNLCLVSDLFNVLNANTALVRNDNIASPTFDALAQHLGPRSARVALTVGF
jgi:hypothetical protein